MWQEVLEYRRENLAEVVIHGSISWVSGNKEIHSLGIKKPIFSRSLVKPFQIKAIQKELSTLLTDEEKALSLSSHNAEPFHMKTLGGMLEEQDIKKLKLPEALPLMFSEGKKPHPLFHSCSGKHAAILKACEKKGWDKSSYTSTDHNYHAAYLKKLRDYLGENFEPKHIAEDGCGLPSVSLTVRELATLFSKLVKEKDDDWIWEVMTKKPKLIGGTGRLDTQILESTKGRVLAKEGADGLLALSVCHRDYPEGLGIVIKLAHGWDMKAMGFIAADILSSLGFDFKAPPAPDKQTVHITAELCPKTSLKRDPINLGTLNSKKNIIISKKTA